MSDAIVSISGLAKSFGVEPLFSDLSFTLEAGEKLVLIGPNGSGKSTLLKIIADREEADSGSVARTNGLTMSYVAQRDSFPKEATIGSVLQTAVADLPEDEQDRLINVGCALGNYTDRELLVETFSGGQRKRLAIVAGLMREPTLLLLDEPTNHLDIAGVLWLEDQLAQFRGAVLMVSHDRLFIEHVAERVVEINRLYPEGSFSVRGSYSTFLETRDNFFAQQSATRASLENKVRREVEWLRQGAKARTTKQKGRIQEAGRLIEQLDSFKDVPEKSSLNFAESDSWRKELIKLEGVSQEIGGKQLFSEVTLLLKPGTRLGVVGPNGCGKSTFIRTALGELPPKKGKVTLAKQLQVKHLDQHRALPDQNVTLRRALCPDGDGVVWRGQPLHIVSWAKKFLFTVDQLDQPVRLLSGGEQARVLLANHMRESADLLILDEPTNDLDIPMLEALEEALLDFSGALILVTHDRYFLERLATQVFGFLPGGKALLFASYEQWEEAYRQALREQKKSAQQKNADKGNASQKTERPKKLSYKDQLDWANIEAMILAAEEKEKSLAEQLHSPEVVSDAAKVAQFYGEHEAAQKEVERLYIRWEELSARVAEIEGR